MNVNLREDLATRLRTVDPGWARSVAEPDTQIAPVPTPFLKDYYVVQLKQRLPSGPMLLYVACGPAGEAIVLNGDAAAVTRMLASDGVEIRDEKAALGIAELYLQVVLAERVLLRSAADLPWRPNLPPALETLKRALTAELEPLLRPPIAVARIDGSFDVSFFVVDEMSVLRMTLTVGRDGRLTSSSEVAKDGLPLVYRM